MMRVAGVRWRSGDPVTYVDAGDLALHLRGHVVLQGEKGQELGWVVREPKTVVAMQPDGTPSFRIVRRATASDLGRLAQNREQEQDAFKVARAKRKEMGLAMKIIDAHFTFDRSRLIVKFGAEGRVDFRGLLQGLSSQLKCRVELRQVGDREVAKLAGGLGRCGQELCCSKWMTKFDAISIRMAKEQALPISADGLAGRCGRLRCCLRFEYEQYRQINRALPKIGEEVSTPGGLATVIVGHRLKESVSVRYDDDRVLELPLAEVTRQARSVN
ncbi:MAG: hypothetical protein BZY88_17075 [SAR202 cluster bacterium Io17-Chloro-G9]|nr:MAG: hypothetical protein BZY88_17075 [SAR202 cluster bacterium Io17-Chloro-G9]